MILIVLIVLSLIGAAIILLVQARQQDEQEYDQLERRAMPMELAMGELLFSEQTFRIDAPARLVAKVDQVFRSPAGQLVMMETKTRYRHKAYLYDVIELSVQALVLRYSKDRRVQGHRIADHAYVRVIAPGRDPAYLRVAILTEETVLAWHARYHQLMNRRVKPRPATDTRSCQKCPQRTDCPQASGIK